MTNPIFSERRLQQISPRRPWHCCVNVVVVNIEWCCWPIELSTSLCEVAEGPYPLSLSQLRIKTGSLVTKDSWSCPSHQFYYPSGQAFQFHNYLPCHVTHLVWCPIFLNRFSGSGHCETMQMIVDRSICWSQQWTRRGTRRWSDPRLGEYTEIYAR